LLNTDTDIAIEAVSWTNSTLRLSMKVVHDSTRWLVTCAGASDWRIQDRWTEGLILSEDDPVLWRSQFAIYTTYFAGKPSEAHRAACDLLSIIPKSARVLDVRPNALADLLATGCGSLGSLPVPAIHLLKPVLQTHGVDLYYLGSDESNTTALRSALLFGDGSFVVAEQFHAELQD
jgi:hypothetical protein